MSLHLFGFVLAVTATLILCRTENVNWTHKKEKERPQRIPNQKKKTSLTVGAGC